MAVTIDRIGEIDLEDFYERYSKRSLPVILLNCIEHWPARKSWTLEHFEKLYPSKQLNFGGRNWIMADFLRVLRSGAQPAPYLKEVKLDEQFPELNAEIGDLKFTHSNLLRSRYLTRDMRISKGVRALFIGSAGSGFGKLHWDHTFTHVFISQIRGEKDFVFFHPSDTGYLYPDPDYPNKSLIDDFNNFDEAKYPDVAKASPMRLTLREGETLFIPAGWWHATSMSDVSISVAESSLDAANWRKRANGYLEKYREANVPTTKRALLHIYMRLAEKLIR